MHGSGLDENPRWPLHHGQVTVDDSAGNLENTNYASFAVKVRNPLDFKPITSQYFMLLSEGKPMLTVVRTFLKNMINFKPSRFDT